MFEDLFTRPCTIASYHAAPLLDERLRYLRHCTQAGVGRATLRQIAAHQLDLVHYLGLRKAERVSMPRIEAAAAQWLRRTKGRPSGAVRPKTRRVFVGRALRWLRFVDLLAEPCKVRHTLVGEVAAFAAWMREDRGWSEETIRTGCNTVDRFFEWLDEWDVALASVGPADIDRAVARWHARGCGRLTIRNYAQQLRGFFRFAEHRGWCTPGLADGIMPLHFHPGETVPKGLNRDQVLRLLKTSEGNRPVDVRDRAILMALIAYGLRAGEVTGLRLDDVDWGEETLRVRRPKPGRTHHYPLSRGVGQAIVRYLTDVRPQRPERAIFLTLTAPIRPLGRTAVSMVVRRRLGRIGLTGERCGAHALRHAVAQHLLDHGLSMKEVGDYLGHRSVSSTAIYAKVRLGTLREVADIDLGGLV